MWCPAWQRSGAAAVPAAGTWPGLRAGGGGLYCKAVLELQRAATAAAAASHRAERSSAGEAACFKAVSMFNVASRAAALT